MTNAESLKLREQDLAGKVAIVIGASEGTGRAIALQLGSRGCSVLGTCSNTQAVHHIDTLSRSIQNIYNDASTPQTSRIVGIEADIMKTGCSAKIITALRAQFAGQVDILVNDTFVDDESQIGPVEADKVQHILLATVQNPIMIVNDLVKEKMFRPNTRIVNISSITTSAWTVHAVVKAAQEAMVCDWARTLGKNPQSDFMKGTTANSVVMRTTTAPAEDVADVVGFLCGKNSKWVTGSIVSACGGAASMS